jgi:hypothetical protein
MAVQQITLGLSEHRPEMISRIGRAMRKHQAIFLEEPADRDFDQMLSGRRTVEEYLSGIDAEYPEFSREMCYLLRDLKARGKEIIQVEPYLEILLGIHAYFAEGNSPADLARDSIQYPVYLAERNATRTLISFYDISMSASFEETIEAVKRFARKDAARFRLRDSLRAQAMASQAQEFSTVYIEAGVIHYALWRNLRQEMDTSVRLKLLFLADDANGLTSPRMYRYAPGDKLTLLYIFHPTYSEIRRENLLAARSLIYSKLIAKNELTEDLTSWPHLRDELKCIHMANRLSLDDCRDLYFRVRHSDTRQAHEVVQAYLSR